MTETTASVDLDKIVSLCKRRGFIFQSSEIYGGLGSTWDYGPLGVEMKRNVKDAWWRDMVLGRDDMVGLDSAILMHPDVWRASGHVESFTDPLVECTNCRRRFRADQLEFAGTINLDLTSTWQDTPFFDNERHIVFHDIGITAPDSSIVLEDALFIGQGQEFVLDPLPHNKVPNPRQGEHPLQRGKNPSSWAPALCNRL